MHAASECGDETVCSWQCVIHAPVDAPHQLQQAAASVALLYRTHVLSGKLDG